MDTSSDNIKAMLLQDAAKTFCCDCGKLSCIADMLKGLTNPTYVSVNNGTFICLTCANIHGTFGEHISYVRSIKDGEWLHQHFLYLRLGGNSNFQAFMQNYGLLPVAPSVKYMTRASEYYRGRVYLILCHTNIARSYCPRITFRLCSSFYRRRPWTIWHADIRYVLDSLTHILGDKALAAGKEVATEVAKASAFVYDKGKIATGFVVQKGKEIMVSFIS